MSIITMWYGVVYHVVVTGCVHGVVCACVWYVVGIVQIECIDLLQWCGIVVYIIVGVSVYLRYVCSDYWCGIVIHGMY